MKVTTAVTVGQMQTSYQHLETDDFEKFSEETFESAQKGFVRTSSHGGTVHRMMLVGAGMEVSVWPQEKYDEWMTENNKARAQAVGARELNSLLIPDLRGRRS